jgi:hypothetical protein
MAETSECLGEKLKPRWWRDVEQIQHEVKAHGNLSASALAHGLSPSTVQKGWAACGLPKLPQGGPAGNGAHVVRDERPVDDPRRLEQRSSEEELRYWKRRARELDQALTNREATVRRIIEAVNVPVDRPKFKPAPSRPKNLPERSAILPVYDVQYGQLVQPSDTPLGLGQYDDAVFQERLARWVDGVSRSMLDYASAHQITELVVALGGDLVEGADIFAGQAWQLEKDPARQCRELSVHLAAALGEVIRVAKEEIGVRRVMVTAVPGNHGKVGGRKAGAIPATMSWDHLCVEFLQLETQGLPIDVWGIEPAGALLFETAGHLFLQIHGDEIRGWGGLPFYGLTKYDGRALRLTGEVYDYCLLGHHHQPASIPNGSGGEFIVSGDWVGANNLSVAIAAASRPQQNLLFVAEKYGITEKVPIYFTPSARPRPRVYSSAA